MYAVMVRFTVWCVCPDRQTAECVRDLLVSSGKGFVYLVPVDFPEDSWE